MASNETALGTFVEEPQQQNAEPVSGVESQPNLELFVKRTRKLQPVTFDCCLCWSCGTLTCEGTSFTNYNCCTLSPDTGC